MLRHLTDPSLVSALKRAELGDWGAVIQLLRHIRTNRLSFAAEVELVDVLYSQRARIHGKRAVFVLALLCERTRASLRSQALLLELVAVDYPPAMHALGTKLIEAGRVSAGMHLMELSRQKGYRLGDVSYWMYRRRFAKRPMWLIVAARVQAAKLLARFRSRAAEEHDLLFRLPE